MLSIGAMTIGQCDYYTHLSREDYYFEGGEPEGTWFGVGAGRLGLQGKVCKARLGFLFRGFDKQGQALVQNAGKSNRQSGWDLTFSAPKSVSFLWSQLDHLRQQVLDAHREAVTAALSYLEDHFAFSRIGKQGHERTPVGIVAAMFEHCTSRALDMQIHTHALVLNLGIDDGGQTRALLSKPLYEAKMLAGAFYRCELAKQLKERLGVEIIRPMRKQGPASWFEVKGIPGFILSHYSKRREAILEELKARRLESASAAAFAALGTREPKTIVPPRAELFHRWKEEGKQFGFDAGDVLGKPKPLTPKQSLEKFQEALTVAVSELSQIGNSFSTKSLIQRTLEVAQPFGLSARFVADQVKETTLLDARFVSLGSLEGEPLWTTETVLNEEHAFRQSVVTLRARPFRGISDELFSATARKLRGQGQGKFSLDVEQQEGLRYLTQGKESIKCVSGFAGTGKTDLLAAAKEALERAGYEVLGTALAAVAARTLQEKTGIPSQTIRQTELRLFPDLGYVFRHHARQLTRAAQGRETFPLPKLNVTPRTVLIVDEAGMVGVQDFSMLTKAVVERGGTLIAVGDEKQLPAIQHPGCFHYLVKELPGTKLTEIRRQRDPADQIAVKRASAGEAEQVLQHYVNKGRCFVARSQSESEARLLFDWQQNGGAMTPIDHRIFVSTRAEVDRLNKLCQWQRVLLGSVNPQERVEQHGKLFMAGDRVAFHKSDPILGIKKGEKGTIVGAKQNTLGKYVAVKIDEHHASFSQRILKAAKVAAQGMLNEALKRKPTPLLRRGSIILVPLSSMKPAAKTYRDLLLDYATTTHSGQGQTIAHNYILLSGKMTSRELSYVQVSRHKESLALYTHERLAGKSLTEQARKTLPLSAVLEPTLDDVPDYSLLAHKMRLSQAAELALERIKRQEITQTIQTPVR